MDQKTVCVMAAFSDVENTLSTRYTKYRKETYPSANSEAGGEIRDRKCEIMY